jgi:4-amino-4-deoxy-L-arabinose transferase-like glycosyltransferase
MKKPKLANRLSYNRLGVLAFCLIVLFILLVRLGSLTKGFSMNELQASALAVGWHGIYNSPLNLPLKLVRSADFAIFKTHGQTLSRLPNVVLGFISILALSYLLYIWHGKRSAVLAGALFATSAWTLHISRLASYDVVYYFAITLLLLGHALLRRKQVSLKAWYFNLVVWGMLLTIPGCVWLVIVDLLIQRDLLINSFKSVSKTTRQKTIAVILFVVWLPLTAIDLVRPDQFKLWLGLPVHFLAPLKLLKQFVAVFVHLFIRGPQYPQLWLGKAPLFDAFTLVMALIGIYFYARHWKNQRTLSLGSLFLVSFIVVGIGGPVSFSLVVPFVYIAAAMGISYILHSWLSKFPNNPIGRNFGIGLLSLVVLVSCIYNLRAYFVAWPHNPVTAHTFSHRLRSNV